MYQIGELIIYGGEGVCKVDAISTPDIKGIDQNRRYYTLSPIYHSETIMTPVDTTVFTRQLISFEQAQRIIESIPFIVEDAYDNRYSKQLVDHYQSYLKSHDCGDLVKLIKSIYSKNLCAVKQGKKLSQTFTRLMKKAEHLLFGEFAIALGIPYENVKDYIAETVKENENRTQKTA